MIGPGSRLAHYEIDAALGKGGMGEVWRARDTKLGREVAIKTLPSEFAEDPDRLARFEREAKLLASLNHPNIAAIYGLEEHEGSRFLVLELVEGDTLADRVQRAAIPVDESLSLALQIAEALEAAHEKGVVHRDLKPANIKVTPDGKVKVLDFGLAKAFAGEQPDANLSNSPTLSMQATQAGIILGTASYMSPEQAKGRKTDKRTDIWAFGCVLYEMLSGVQAFSGEDVSSILARVLEREPGYERLPRRLHPGIRGLLERCLEKNTSNRYRDIGDVRYEIQRILADPDGVAPPGIPPGRIGVMLKSAVMFALLIALAGAFAFFTVRRSVESLPVTAFVHSLPAGQGFRGEEGPVSDISADGRFFVFNTDSGIYFRSMDEASARVIPGTEEGNVSSPFISPSGDSVGFYADGWISVVSVNGGTPRQLVAATNLYGASWSDPDTIFYGQRDGIWMVGAGGGEGTRIVDLQPGERVYGPRLLPGGEWLMFTLTDATRVRWWASARIVVKSLDSDRQITLVEGATDARYLSSGHLVYAKGQRLMAVPFDVAGLRPIGDEVPVVDGLRRPTLSEIDTGSVNYSVSGDGTLLYVAPRPASAALSSIVSVGRDGQFNPIVDEPWVYRAPRLSPQGDRIAVRATSSSSPNHIRVIDVQNPERAVQLTFEGGSNPVWTADGNFLVFNGTFGGVSGLWTIAADGRGQSESLRAVVGVPTDLSPNDVLAFYQVSTETGRDLWTLPLDDVTSASPFLDTQFEESGARFSTDGNWLAYVSDRSGQREVWVRPYPGTGDEYLVSTGGGYAPAWSRDGRELYYVNSDGFLVAANFFADTSFAVQEREELYEVRDRFALDPVDVITPYDVAPNGSFLFVLPGANADLASIPETVSVVVNWSEELKERVPVP